MNCPLCQPQKTLWKNAAFTIVDASDENFPLYWRIVTTRHVKEMTDLDPSEQAALFALLLRLESLIRTHIPDVAKLNWAQFGNVVPHLHWHLIARWTDDSYYPETPWGLMQRSVPKHVIAARRQQSETLGAQLPTLLSDLGG